MKSTKFKYQIIKEFFVVLTFAVFKNIILFIKILLQINSSVVPFIIKNVLFLFIFGFGFETLK